MDDWKPYSCGWGEKQRTEETFADVEFSATWLAELAFPECHCGPLQCTLSVVSSVARNFQCPQRFIYIIAGDAAQNIASLPAMHHRRLSLMMPNSRRHKLKPKLMRIINARTVVPTARLANYISYCGFGPFGSLEVIHWTLIVSQISSQQRQNVMIAPTFVYNSSFASFSRFPYSNLTLECFANGRPSEVIKILIEARRIREGEWRNRNY